MPDYESIPTSGQHRGPKQSNDTGTEVRTAESDASAQPGESETIFRLVHSPEQRRYRLSRWAEGSPVEAGYEELGRYREAELGSALSHLPEAPRFVVFENSKTGEVNMQRETEVSANWTDGGRFDQVLFFDDEAEAAEYAASRQG